MSAVSHDEFDDANNRISAQLDDLYRLVGEQYVQQNEHHRQAVAQLAVIGTRLARLEASATSRFDQIDARFDAVERALERIQRHLGMGDQ